jgi:hypothetical protein
MQRLSISAVCTASLLSRSLSGRSGRTFRHMAREPDIPPYELQPTKTFYEDCKLIHAHRQTFKRMFNTARFILERAPYTEARSMDEEGRFWVRTFPAHKTTNRIDVPELVVSYEIVRHPPPRGLIRLRHVRTADDIAAGLHLDAEPF